MRSVLAASCVALVGCYQPDYGGAPFLCQQSDRCPPGYGCVAGVCRAGAPAADAQAAPDRDAARLDRAAPADRRADLPPAPDHGPDAPPAPDGRPDAPPACAPVGAPCDDANPCTTGDACTAGGVCAGVAAPDGSSCGALPAEVCCAGQCANLTRDEAHCGGCGLSCAAGYTCADAASPPKCDQSPANTSGRCRCAGGNSALCPHGQSCRTNTPADGWCTPDAPAECAPGQHVELVTNCPNYCAY